MNTANEGNLNPNEIPVTQFLQANPETLRLRGRKYVAGLLHGLSVGILLAAVMFGDLPVGLGSLAAVLILFGWLALQPVKCQVARLRVMAGDFAETDIDTIFRQAVALERQGDARRASTHFRMVAESSGDPENDRLAKTCLQRLATSRS